MDEDTHEILYDSEGPGFGSQIVDDFRMICYKAWKLPLILSIKTME